MNGKREGRGEESSQYGQYKGNWKSDLKHGIGEERSLVGTTFNGNWDKGKKNGRGVRKMIFGTIDEQVKGQWCYMLHVHKQQNKLGPNIFS